MGGSSSSPRSVTIEQDESSGVVKVSEAVARRLVGKPEPGGTEAIGSADTSRAIPQTEVNSEIEKISTRYEKRIKALEKQNKTLHQTTTEQFAKAVEEVEQKFLKTTAAPICDDLQNEVMKCYQDNPKESLNCSQIVKAYSSCVQNQRQSILTKKDEDCQPCMLAQMARGPCGIHFMKAYDCYLEGADEDECAQRYLAMKECWDQNPNYGYQKIIDKAYGDDKPGESKGNTGDKPGEAKANIGDKPGEAKANIGDKPGDTKAKTGDKPGEAKANTGDKPGESKGNTELTKDKSNGSSPKKSADSNSSGLVKEDVTKPKMSKSESTERKPL